MLVLSRKLGEEIIIGPNIRITIVAVRGKCVRLGFTAPDDVAIHRSELLSPNNDLALSESRAIVVEEPS